MYGRLFERPQAEVLVCREVFQQLIVRKERFQVATGDCRDNHVTTSVDTVVQVAAVPPQRRKLSKTGSSDQRTRRRSPDDRHLVVKHHRTGPSRRVRPRRRRAEL